MRALRQHFWLHMMDVCHWVRMRADAAYTFALVKASDATDWGADEGGEGEPPW